MQWSPRPGETVALVAVALGLGLALVVLDAPGRPPRGARARCCCSSWVPATSWCGRGWRPGPDGVEVRTWPGVGICRGRDCACSVRESRRLGDASRTLELDSCRGPDDDGVLVVLGRRDLGADPDDVARTLRGLAPTGS